MENRLKPTTMENKKHLIEKKILPYFGKLKLCDIDTLKVRKWQNTLLSQTDKNGKSYSQTYLKTIHNQLSAILNYAVTHYHLPSNPCRAAGSIGKKNAEEMNIWTQTEYETFSANITKQPLKLAFDILFYTGMRSGELLALTPADILPNKRINISKNYARMKGQDLILTPKTPKSKRQVAIPDFLYDDIKKYISTLYDVKNNERMFTFTKPTLVKAMNNGAKKAGLKHIRVHDLRHCHASMLIDMGFDALEIADRLGHESVKTTLDTYSHLYPDNDVKLAKALNKFRT
jgi:integrase